jgi:hypothetical protein
VPRQNLVVGVKKTSCVLFDDQNVPPCPQKEDVESYFSVHSSIIRGSMNSGDALKSTQLSNLSACHVAQTMLFVIIPLKHLLILVIDF